MTWRHTWDHEGPDFTLERGRESDAEIVGRVMKQQRSHTAVIPVGWSWSLTCACKFVGIPKPAYAIGGFVATKQEACEALMAAWRQEEAWRADALATVDLGAHPASVRAYLTHGQPVPPRWEHEKSAPAGAEAREIDGE